LLTTLALSLSEANGQKLAYIYFKDELGLFQG
jgi:hypothetical protein